MSDIDEIKRGLAVHELGNILVGLEYDAIVKRAVINPTKVQGFADVNGRPNEINLVGHEESIRRGITLCIAGTVAQWIESGRFHFERGDLARAFENIVHLSNVLHPSPQKTPVDFAGNSLQDAMDRAS